MARTHLFAAGRLAGPGAVAPLDDVESAVLAEPRRPDASHTFGSGSHGETGLANVVATACGLVVAGAALVVLAGWLLDVPVMRELVPGFVAMKFNTAACFFAGGLALVLRGRRRLRLLLMLVVLMVGSLTLSEYLIGVDLGIDEFLVLDQDSGVVRNPPGRMAVVTALAFTAQGCAWLLVHYGRHVMGQVLLVIPALVGVLTLLGYAYGAEGLYRLVAATTVSLPTGFGLVLLAVGVAVRVRGGFAQWVLLDQGAGGILVRRLLPVGLVLIPVLGFIRLQGELRGYYGTRYGLVLMVTMAGLAVSGASVAAARRAATLDRARARAQSSLEELNARLVEGRDEAWRRAESLGAALAEERARFARAIARVDDLVWTVEVMPDRSVLLVYDSANSANLFGGELPAEGNVAETMSALVHPDDAGVNEQFNLKVLAGEPAEAELRLVGFDQVTRWVWVRGFPRREGERTFYDGITTNITERRQVAERLAELAELQQEQVAELGALHRARDQFFAAAGHELRTPLTVIAGYSALLAEDTLTAQQAEWVSTIGRRTSDASALLDEVFDLAKVNAGVQPLARHELALEDLVLGCVEDHVPRVREAGLTIGTELDSVQVLGDARRLTQIIDNLLSNAIKYTPAGGHITVRCHAAPDGVQVQVQDNGIGIPEHELTRLFDPFYRASTATAAAIQGTGLGLHISRSLAEAHGGTLLAHSSKADGTTFTLSLPRAAG